MLPKGSAQSLQLSCQAGIVLTPEQGGDSSIDSPVSVKTARSCVSITNDTSVLPGKRARAQCMVARLQEKADGTCTSASTCSLHDGRSAAEAEHESAGCTQLDKGMPPDGQTKHVRAGMYSFHTKSGRERVTSGRAR